MAADAAARRGAARGRAAAGGSARRSSSATGWPGGCCPGSSTRTVSRTALGRLEQPLTYWNAIGALAAIGFMLGTRVLGDPERPPWLRALLGAATVPLGLGVVLTFSRGTLIALAVGLALLCLLAPTRAQLRAAALALGGHGRGVGVGIAFDGVRTLGRLDGRPRGAGRRAAGRARRC